MKKFYNDNQTLINIIGLIASILTIIGFFTVGGDTTNNNTITDSFTDVTLTKIMRLVYPPKFLIYS